jgi:hypothetical protein
MVGGTISGEVVSGIINTFLINKSKDTGREVDVK